MTLFPSKTAINRASYLFKKLFKVFENYPKSKYHIKIFFQENIVTLSKNGESSMALQRQAVLSVRAPQLSMTAAAVPVCRELRASFPTSSQSGDIRKSRPLT